MQTEKFMTYLKKAMDEFLGYLKAKEPISVKKLRPSKQNKNKWNM